MEQVDLIIPDPTGISYTLTPSFCRGGTFDLKDTVNLHSSSILRPEHEWPDQTIEFMIGADLDEHLVLVGLQDYTLYGSVSLCHMLILFLLLKTRISDG